MRSVQVSKPNGPFEIVDRDVPEPMGSKSESKSKPVASVMGILLPRREYFQVQRSSIKRRYNHIFVTEVNKNRKYLAKRWVVERRNSWHNRFRKLLIRYVSSLLYPSVNAFLCINSYVNKTS